MKKMIIITIISVFSLLAFNPANADESPGPAPNSEESPGPAPNSGDGIPDGSGFQSPPSPGPGNGK